MGNIGMFGAPFTQLMVDRKCAKHGLDAEHCHYIVDGVKQPEFLKASSEAAEFMSNYSLITGLVSVAVCAFYGVLGDSFGRRFALLPPLFGGTLTCLCIALVPADQEVLLMVLTG